MYIQTFEEKIKQRRSQMLIHSYIYYILDDSIVSDDKWQEWADELAILQNEEEYPMIGWYDKEFRDWTGETGYHLPRDPWIAEKATYLLRLHHKYSGE